MSRRRFAPRTFILVTLLAAGVLLTIVAVPQWLSRQARLEVLRDHVGQIARLAASVVDGDRHRVLAEPGGYTDERYREALAPLVRFHSANPDIFYVYTMVDRAGQTFFVLDTAASPDLKTPHPLRASAYMERFQLRPEYESDWLQQLAAGRTWINPDFQVDDYGNFLSAHAPIHDSRGRYSGFVGVDFDLAYYLAQEARFRQIAAGSLLAALLAAVIIGYLVALYHFDLRHRMEEHYRMSVRDHLTGLLNRRGVLDVIPGLLQKRASSVAMLLIDIDELKKINDSHGHTAGDAVITDIARSIGESVRAGDECARLGGDEFIVVAPECDAESAAGIASRILSRINAHAERAGLRFSVSIGITIRDPRDADFDELYRDADAALYHAKARGKQRYAFFEPCMQMAVQPPRRA